MTVPPRILPAARAEPAVAVPVVVVGAGACGLTAALAARDAGSPVVVLEADPTPTGSTSLSAGLIPAAGTRWQAAEGIADSPARLAADIADKTGGEADAAATRRVAEQSAPAVEWLADAHGLALSLVDGFVYPGHSVRRLHGPPGRTGAELLAQLRAAAEAAGVDILTSARVHTLHADGDGRIAAVAYDRPDGTTETLGCTALVLACNGYGGNPDRLRRHMPQIADALYFGHPGNRGEAVDWGEALGAATRHLGAFQGHGSVAAPHGILITWATIMEGGIQVDRTGRRFSDETHGYSEQAAAVLARPGGEAWTIFDERIAAVARQFEDFRLAEDQGAVKRAADVAGLARATGLLEPDLAAALDEIDALAASGAADRFGRRFDPARRLAPPYLAVRVTGALFHTQGGLVVDANGRVLRPDGSALPNLFAGGGAACGLSGAGDRGYLSGNGLLTAVVYGRLAGRAAADLARTLERQAR